MGTRMTPKIEIEKTRMPRNPKNRKKLKMENQEIEQIPRRQKRLEIARKLVKAKSQKIVIEKKREHMKKVQRTRSGRRRKDNERKKPIERRVAPAARKILRVATASGVLRVQAQRLRQ